MSSNRPPNQPTLREEGIEARNFVSWRVPKTIPKDALESATKNEKSVNINSSATSVADSNNLSAFSSANYKEMTKYKLPSTSPHSNVSVASMRLWKLIFQNVCRSVDELYAFCEEEQNGELCEQSFQFFLSSCRDFAQLAQKYDKSDQNISLSEKVCTDTNQPICIAYLLACIHKCRYRQMMSVTVVSWSAKKNAKASYPSRRNPPIRSMSL